MIRLIPFALLAAILFAAAIAISGAMRAAASILESVA